MRLISRTSLQNAIMVLVIAAGCCCASRTAMATPFDIVVPGQIEYRTSNTASGFGTGGFGMLIATDETLDLSDLQGAVLSHSINLAGITSVTHEFVFLDEYAPLTPGEAAVSGISSANPLRTLLMPGETAVPPASGGLRAFYALSLGAPPPVAGNAVFNGSVRMGDHIATFTTDILISRAQGSSSPRITNPQRITAALVPEPSSLITALVGLLCVGAGVGYRLWRGGGCS